MTYSFIRIYIERNPAYFTYIIRYLLVPPPTAQEQSLIEQEFAYYGIPFRFQICNFYAREAKYDPPPLLQLIDTIPLLFSYLF